MNKRKSHYSIEPLILNRWSPRAMSGEMVSDKQLFTLFDAARWAPSSYNSQPWRFLYAKRETPYWDTFFNLLVHFNKRWTEKAGILVLILSKKNFEHNDKFSRSHSFDTGAAWQNLALQGHALNLVIHGMSGFDYEKARETLNIPNDYAIEAMCAIGHKAPSSTLPPDLQEMEKISDRKPLRDLVFEGSL